MTFFRPGEFHLCPWMQEECKGMGNGAEALSLPSDSHSPSQWSCRSHRY